MKLGKGKVIYPRPESEAWAVTTRRAMEGPDPPCTRRQLGKSLQLASSLHP